MAMAVGQLLLYIIIFALMGILGFGIYVFRKASVHINQVALKDSLLYFSGIKRNTPISFKYDIYHTEIKIKVRASKHKSSREFYLIFESAGKTVSLNEYYNWDYQYLLEVFYTFKKIKGEKVIWDERFVIDSINERMRY